MRARVVGISVILVLGMAAVAVHVKNGYPQLGLTSEREPDMKAHGRQSALHAD